MTSRRELNEELESMADIVQLAGGPTTIIPGHLADLAEMLPKMAGKNSIIITIVYAPEVGLALICAGDNVPDGIEYRDAIIGPICQGVADMIAAREAPLMEYIEHGDDED